MSLAILAGVLVNGHTFQVPCDDWCSDKILSQTVDLVNLRLANLLTFFTFQSNET